MMTNLFSTFDRSTGIMSTNWMSMSIILFMMPFMYWTMPNKILMTMNKTFNKIHQEYKMMMSHKGTTLIMISTTMTIMFNNTMGLMPYVFTSSAHLVFSLSLALPTWMSYMIYGWMKKTNKMFKHLVPTGTSMMLTPFMIIIEMISNMIRPESLAVRLTANMIAGHLLMSLLGNNNSGKLMMAYSTVFITLMMFEFGVALIQSYVFMTLMNLYSSEV